MTENPQDHQQQHSSGGWQPQDSPPPFNPAPPQYSGPQPPHYGGPQQPQYGGPQQPYQPVPMTPADQRTWAIAAHLSAFLAVFVALSFLGPLIVYLVFKDRGLFVRQHAAEALNFQLTMWIGLLISLPLMIVGIGFITAAIIGVTMLVCQILGAVAASEGREYQYPVRIRFVS